MATFPARFSVIGKAVQSLLDQRLPPTRILIHVNESDVPPRFPTMTGLKFIAHRMKLTDIGKFKMTEKVSEGYILTVDDDIIYPEDYMNLISIGFSDLKIKSSQDSTVRCSCQRTNSNLAGLQKSSSCTLVQTRSESTLARSNRGNGNNGLPRENPSV